MRNALRTGLLGLGLSCLFVTAGYAEVKPNRLFTDHAVLQRDVPMPVWGTADDGEQVTVTIGDQQATTTAEGGKWRVTLKPLAAGGPVTMTIKGPANTVTVNDVLIGDVWVCSGQSNMEWRLSWGNRPKPDPEDWPGTVAKADFPMIRQFLVEKNPSFEPVSDAIAKWSVCSPSTAPQFTAVGFFFACDLQPRLNVPIGLINTSWGGTPAEAWTTPQTLRAMPDQKDHFADRDRRLEEQKNDMSAVLRKIDEWFAKYDVGVTGGWASVDAADADWPTAEFPVDWEKIGLGSFNGIAWFRRTIDVPESHAGKPATLRLGRVDDQDTTYVNGELVGGMEDNASPRVYKLPAGALKAGRNVIAVRVLDIGGAGGFVSPADQMLIEFDDKSLSRIPLSGAWSYKQSIALADAPNRPFVLRPRSGMPGTLFDGMVNPLLPFPIKGVIWYQGESNSGRSKQYRTLFPAMIADWRRVWGQGDFPFLFVQIAPHEAMSPDIREAQMLTLKASPNTAMAVLTDIGDLKDIHPPLKKPVGERLALAARALAYGEKIEYSGPIYESMSVEGASVVVRFTHVGAGLEARDGDLRGFEIAGADGKFVPAKATITGDAVVVTADGVGQPAHVRYGWRNFPGDVNLFNKDGLPASPFRTNP